MVSSVISEISDKICRRLPITKKKYLCFLCETKNHVFPECCTLRLFFSPLQLGASPSVNDDFISRAAIHCVGRQWNVKTFSNHALFSLKKGRGKRNELGRRDRLGNSTRRWQSLQRQVNIALATMFSIYRAISVSPGDTRNWREHPSVYVSRPRNIAALLSPPCARSPSFSVYLVLLCTIWLTYTEGETKLG